MVFLFPGCWGNIQETIVKLCDYWSRQRNEWKHASSWQLMVHILKKKKDCVATCWTWFQELFKFLWTGKIQCSIKKYAKTSNCGVFNTSNSRPVWLCMKCHRIKRGFCLLVGSKTTTTGNNEVGCEKYGGYLDAQHQMEISFSIIWAILFCTLVLGTLR